MVSSDWKSTVAVFDVIVNGEIVAEHRHEPNAHIFPDIQDLMKAINSRLG